MCGSLPTGCGGLSAPADSIVSVAPGVAAVAPGSLAEGLGSGAVGGLEGVMCGPGGTEVRPVSPGAGRLWRDRRVSRCGGGRNAIANAAIVTSHQGVSPRM